MKSLGEIDRSISMNHHNPPRGSHIESQNFRLRMIQEYYRQMRKFGCNILAVVQQYEIIKDSAVTGAMIGNSKMFLITAQQSREDLKEIGEALSLSPKTIETINNY